ncbi:unnamed protein product [Aphanomyces euteiches]
MRLTLGLAIAALAASPASSLDLNGWYNCAYYTSGRRLDATTAANVHDFYGINRPWPGTRAFVGHTTHKDTPAAALTSAGSSVSAQCGSYTLPLCHQGVCNSTKTISVFAKRIPGTTSKAVWLLQGGPGASSVNMEGFMLDWYNRLGGAYSVYTIDHRGTGRSEYLGCRNSQAQTGGSPGGASVTLSELPTCLLDLQRTYDYQTAAFSITSAAKDIAAIVGDIPESDVYIYGVSYGTVLVERVMHLDPPKVKGYVLDSVQSEDYTSWTDSPTFSNWDRDFDIIAKRFLDYCTRDATCASYFPSKNITTDLAALYAKLDGNTTSDCATLVQNTLGSTDDTPSDLLRVFFGSLFPDMGRRALIPVFVHRLLRCSSSDLDVLNYYFNPDPSGNGSSSSDSTASDAPDSDLLYKTIVYSELWQRPTPGYLEMYSTFSSTLMASGLYPMVGEYCVFAGAMTENHCYELSSVLPSDATPAINFTYTPDAYFNVTTAVPSRASVVVLSGKLDPQTPSNYAEHQFQKMSGAAKRLYSFDYAAHATIVTTPVVTPNSPTCAVSIILSYVQNQGDVTNIDSSCMQSVQPLVLSIDSSTAKQLFNVSDPYDGVIPRPTSTPTAKTTTTKAPTPATTSAPSNSTTSSGMAQNNSYSTTEIALIASCSSLAVLAVLLFAVVVNQHRRLQHAAENLGTKF